MSRGAIALAAGACMVIGTVAMVSATSPSEQKVGIVFWSLAGLIILLGIASEVGGGDGGSRDVTNNITTTIHLPDWMQHPPEPPQREVQYIPVFHDAPPPPQIVYVEKEAPQPGIAQDAVALLVAELREQRAQIAKLERQAATPVPLARQPEAIRIEGGYRRMEVLPPARTAAPEPQPLRLTGPRKSIANRVAVALLAKPKAKQKS